jgi:hypothetical protein
MEVANLLHQQYDQFLLERAQLLAQEANAFLQSLEGA